MGGGGKGGGGGSEAAAAMNFQIMQFMIQEQNRKEAEAKQEEINRKTMEREEARTKAEQERWDKQFAFQQQQHSDQKGQWQQQNDAQAAALSNQGNVSKDNAAKGSAGGAQAGRVKTLYSNPKARTRGSRVVLGDDNNPTVFKRVLGE